MEGLTDCVSDGSEKKLTVLSHLTGENETKQLTENTDYTAIYSNNVHPYTLTPDDAGFDSEKAPKVTLYGTGNYCGKAEHYFTISENTAAAPSITTGSLPDGKVGEAYSQTLTATGTTPITWSIDCGDLPCRSEPEQGHRRDQRHAYRGREPPDSPSRPPTARAAIRRSYLLR